ncbi:hypothetical protein ACLB2K_049039 [Fragaria x ananassa]
MLGVVLDVEDPHVVGNRGYLKLIVDFDTRRPFTTFVPLPRSISRTTKIMLQYEGVKNCCHKCGRLGHSITACRYKGSSMEVAKVQISEIAPIVVVITECLDTNVMKPIAKRKQRKKDDTAKAPKKQKEGTWQREG